MATRNEINSTYNYMDEIFRLKFGEMADISCAMYNGDFSKTLEQAQRDKHEYIIKGLDISKGSRVLDIGCGWGPILNAVKEKGGYGIGLTLSTSQLASCRRNGLEVYLSDWKDIDINTYGIFDGIVSIGSFEHFCSVDEYLAGKQDQIYQDFFNLCHGLLKAEGKLYLQTMMWGINTPKFEDISLKARKGSNEYILAVLRKLYPGSWLPSGEEQILRCADPFFNVISLNNGRQDYIETMKEWNRVWKLSFSQIFIMLKMLKYFLVDKDFRYKLEALVGSYNYECFKREVMDHQRIIFGRR